MSVQMDNYTIGNGLNEAQFHSSQHCRQAPWPPHLIPAADYYQQPPQAIQRTHSSLSLDVQGLSVNSPTHISPVHPPSEPISPAVQNPANSTYTFRFAPPEPSLSTSRRPSLQGLQQRYDEPPQYDRRLGTPATSRSSSSSSGSIPRRRSVTSYPAASSPSSYSNLPTPSFHLPPHPAQYAMVEEKMYNDGSVYDTQPNSAGSNTAVYGAQGGDESAYRAPRDTYEGMISYNDGGQYAPNEEPSPYREDHPSYPPESAYDESRYAHADATGEDTAVSPHSASPENGTQEQGDFDMDGVESKPLISPPVLSGVMSSHAGMNGSASAAVGKPPGVNNFVNKLYQMITDPKSAHFISWTEPGTSFVVSNATEFSRSILGTHFKHNNFSSFVRQLNMYGFHKINRTPRAQRQSTDAHVWEFTHSKFLRGRPDLLDEIKRKALEPDPVVRNRVELPGEVASQLTLMKEDNQRLAEQVACERRKVEQLTAVVEQLWNVVGSSFPGKLPPFSDPNSSESPNIYITSPQSRYTISHQSSQNKLSSKISSHSLRSMHSMKSVSSPGSSPTTADFPARRTVSRQRSFHTLPPPSPVPENEVDGQRVGAKRPRVELVNDHGAEADAVTTATATVKRAITRSRSDSAPLSNYGMNPVGWMPPAGSNGTATMNRPRSGSVRVAQQQQQQQQQQHGCVGGMMMTVPHISNLAQVGPKVLATDGSR